MASGPQNVWEGVYDSFAEAKADLGVFEDSTWLQKTMQRAKNAVTLSCSAEYVAPVAQSSDYVLPVVAALAASSEKPLRILDFGGGMATSYVPLKAMLPVERRLDYVVIENPTICRKGLEFFAGNTDLVFRTELPTPPERFDIAHFGSSLHYVETWRELLTQINGLWPEYLVFADLPAAENISFVTAQNYYGRRIPVWFWNAREFVTQIESLGFILLMKSRYRGYWLDRDEELPTGNFDGRHRLTYLSQFVFRRATS